MRAARFKAEIQRLLRQVPFRPFEIAFENLQRVLVDHPENIAFEPDEATESSSTGFYVLDGKSRLFSTLDAVTIVTETIDMVE